MKRPTMAHPNKQLKTIFLGTSEFAVPFLNALAETLLRPTIVITQPDQPVGRTQALTPSPVKQAATVLGLTVLQPKSKSELEQAITTAQPDLAIVVAYGVLIPSAALTVARYGFINVHPSLLPRYRGPSPVQAALLNGDTTTGVSIMLLDSEMDHGPLLHQEVVTVNPDDTNTTLHTRLGVVGSELLVSTLPKYLADELKPQPQNHDQATYTQLITRDDGCINWSNPAEVIERQFRAFSPWPGIFTYWGSKRLKIENLGILEASLEVSGPVGKAIALPDHRLAVVCGSGAVELKVVQLEGHRSLSSAQFVRGYPAIVTALLGADKKTQR